MTAKRMDLARAIALAERVHADATDKAGQPYIDHVMRVVAAVDTEPEKMAAALHDVVEDTAVTLGDLAENGCPPPVLKAVDALTRRVDEPYDVFLARAEQDDIARQVKIADLIDNSDEGRLGLLPPGEAERLRGKYAAAIESLGASAYVEAWRSRLRPNR